MCIHWRHRSKNAPVNLARLLVTKVRRFQEPRTADFGKSNTSHKVAARGVLRKPSTRSGWAASFVIQLRSQLQVRMISTPHLPKQLRKFQLAISQSSREPGLVACLEGLKINNMPNMASRMFSYIPKVICAAWNTTIIIRHLLIYI